MWRRMTVMMWVGLVRRGCGIDEDGNDGDGEDGETTPAVVVAVAVAVAVVVVVEERVSQEEGVDRHDDRAR